MSNQSQTTSQNIANNLKDAYNIANWKKKNPDDFHCFKFSKKLIKQALPVLKEANRKAKKRPLKAYSFLNSRGVKILKERNY